MISVEEVKQEISQRTGVPLALLTGETTEENIAQAKAFLAYKRDVEATRQKTVKEQFADWALTQAGESLESNSDNETLDEIQEAARIENGGYPKLQDSSFINAGNDKTAKEQFAEWINTKSSFNPFKENIWNRL